MERTTGYLMKRIKEIPEIGLILGSGLGTLAEEMEESIHIPYSEIPGFPLSTAPGHAGKVVVGRLNGVCVIAFSGRFHMYEGYEANEVVFPVRVMEMMGVRNMIVTNAAGGINSDFSQGALVVIKDHINLSGRNPLVGPNDERFGTRFPDMNDAYTPEFREIARKAADGLGLQTFEGVYAGVLGPCFETPAEIRYLKAIGADMVGMSTIPEVIAARHGGMKILGISCITNLAAGLSPERPTHQEVLDTAARVHGQFRSLVLEVIKEISCHEDV